MLLSKVTYSAFRLYIYQYHLSFMVSMCSLGIEPMTFTLLTQCSTTEPQEHFFSGGKLKQQEIKPEEKKRLICSRAAKICRGLFVSYSEISETKNCHRKSKENAFSVSAEMVLENRNHWP